jgi:hypothetical protein
MECLNGVVNNAKNILANAQVGVLAGEAVAA